MNLILLYLLLVKASCTAFSGMTSIPVVRHDFVEKHHVLTDRQLNAAIAAGRTAPGPNGLYLASIGYFVAGVPGGILGAIAVMTPAFFIIPMLQYLGKRADRPRVKSAIQAVTLAASGLVVAATVPLARDAITGWIPAAIAVGTFLFLTLTRGATIWVMIAAACIGFVSYAV